MNYRKDQQVTNLRRELDDMIFRKRNVGRVRTLEKYTQTYQPKFAEKFAQTSNLVVTASSSGYFKNGSSRRKSQERRDSSREEYSSRDGYSSREKYNSKESHKDRSRKYERKTSRDEIFRDSIGSRKRSRSPRDKNHKTENEKRRRREELPVRDTHKEPDLREKILKKKTTERQKSDDEIQGSRSRKEVTDVHMLDTIFEPASVVIKQEMKIARILNLARKKSPEVKYKSSEVEEEQKKTLDSGKTSHALLTSASEGKSETMELIGDLIESMSQDGSLQTRSRMKRLSDALNESHDSNVNLKVDENEERETVKEAVKIIVEAVSDSVTSQQIQGEEKLSDLALLETEKNEILRSLNEEMAEDLNEPAVEEQESKNCSFLIEAKSLQNSVEVATNLDLPPEVPTIPTLSTEIAANHPEPIEDGEICDDSSNEIPAIPNVNTEILVETKARKEKVNEKRGKPEKSKRKSSGTLKTLKSNAKDSKSPLRKPTTSRHCLSSKKSEVLPPESKKLKLNCKKVILEPQHELSNQKNLPNMKKSPIKPLNSLLIPKDLKADEVSGGIQSISLMLGNFEDTTAESVKATRKSHEVKSSEEIVNSEKIKAVEKLTNLKTKKSEKSTKKVEESKKQSEILKLKELKASQDFEEVEDPKQNLKRISMPELVDVPEAKISNSMPLIIIPKITEEPKIKVTIPKPSLNPNFKISIHKPPNIKLSILKPPYNPSKKFLDFETPAIIKNKPSKQAAIKNDENSQEPIASSSQSTSKVIRETSKLKKEKSSSEQKKKKESMETASKLSDLKCESMRIEPENEKSSKKCKPSMKVSPRNSPKSSPGKSSPAKISESPSKPSEDPLASSTPTITVNICQETSVPPITSPCTANDSLDSTTKENSLNGSQINSTECQTKRRSYTKEVMEDGVVVITMSRRKKKKKSKNC